MLLGCRLNFRRLYRVCVEDGSRQEQRRIPMVTSRRGQVWFCLTLPSMGKFILKNTSRHTHTPPDGPPHEKSSIDFSFNLSFNYLKFKRIKEKIFFHTKWWRIV